MEQEIEDGACLSFDDDGESRREVCGGGGKGQAEGRPDSFHLRCQWGAGEGGGCERPRLLGATDEGVCEIQRWDRGVDERGGSDPARGRAWGDIIQTGEAKLETS